MNNLPKEFKFSKKWGQNFLIDSTIPARIAEQAEIDGKDVLEIGPGAGALTLELAPRANRVLCLEVDRQLIEPLRTTLTLEHIDNVTVLGQDAMKADLSALLAQYLPGGAVDVCANLPYSITTPILSRLIDSKLFGALTVMVQLEVAERICADAGTKDYGAFSVYCQFYTLPKLLFTVPPTAFMPRPKVTSAVLRLELKQEFPAIDERELFRVVKLAFGQRRKTLVNALSAAYEKSAVLSVLEKLGLSSDIRGERLSVSEFIALSQIVKEIANAVPTLREDLHGR